MFREVLEKPGQQKPGKLYFELKNLTQYIVRVHIAGKMLGSMFWFFEYRFTILPVLLTIPVFLLLGWLIPCMMYDNAAKCSVVEQLRDAQ